MRVFVRAASLSLGWQRESLSSIIRSFLNQSSVSERPGGQVKVNLCSVETRMSELEIDSHLSQNTLQVDQALDLSLDLAPGYVHCDVTVSVFFVGSPDLFLDPAKAVCSQLHDLERGFKIHLADATLALSIRIEHRTCHTELVALIQT